MSLSAGTRLGPYEIVSPVGAGGMGEVYAGRDTRLDRPVAIKIISDLASGAPDVRERFEREARTISQLNHPHICALYDVGREVPTLDGASAAEPVEFLVMELIEGDSLASRLAKGALPVDQALRVAVEIADALAAAHRRGIIHRDLKPANIMLTRTGAKLLDFGLAKTAAPAVPAGASALPTTPANLTAQGTILGTFQYMAPEQLEGGEADARTDIFAFGSVLYEMLTGRRAFEGRSHAALISSVMSTEPPRVTALQPLAPAMADYAVARCLAKDPDDRWQSARDLGAELRRIAGMSTPPSAGGSERDVVVASRRRRVSAAWGIAAAMTAIAFALGGWILWGVRAAPAGGPLHLAVSVAPAEGVDGHFALSNNGRLLVFTSQSDGRPHLFVRPLNRREATPLVQMAGLRNGGAAFSPDDRWIAFTAQGRLYKVPVGGGAPVQLATGVSGRPMWSATGRIVFENTSWGISAVPENGGDATVLTEAAGGMELGHNGPFLTDDGRTLLFSIRRSDSDWDQGLQLVAQSLQTGERTMLGDGATPSVVYPNRLTFERGGTIYVAGFDPARRQLTSDPLPVIDGVASRLMSPLFSVAQNGTIALIGAREVGVGTGELALVDAAGQATTLPFPPHRYADPRLSPDGQRIAVHTFEEGRENFVADLKRGTITRLTVNPGEDETPVWTPDGRAVVYTSTRQEMERAIFRRMADGSAAEELLWSGKGHLHLGGFTPDGKTLVVSASAGGAAHFDLMTLTLGEKDLKPLIASKATESEPALSPDGHWLAYVSDESGRAEVYVQPFPKLDGRWTISTNGGREPVWSRDGRQLFYRANGRMMRVDIAADSSFTPSVPVAIFEDRFMTTMGEGHKNFDSMPDGRLLMVARAGGSDSLPSHINLVLHALDEKR